MGNISKNISDRIKAFKYAFKGFYLLVTEEHSIITQLIIAVLVCVFGFVMNISATEWLFQILAIGLVLSVEALNTAIERLSDFVHPEHHKKIGIIKDIGAGAAFFAALTAVIIGLVIYLPKLF